MEEKKNSVLLYIILFLIALLIGLGAGYYYFSNKDNRNCKTEESNNNVKCKENNEEDYILDLFSKSDLVKVFLGGKLKLVTSRSGNVELKTKEDLRKFSDDYIINTFFDGILESTDTFWDDNEGVIAIAIEYINSDRYAYYDSDKVYTKELVEDTIKYLFNKRFNLSSYAMNNLGVYGIGDYYYFGRTLGAAEGHFLEFESMNETENTVEITYTGGVDCSKTESDSYAPGSKVKIIYEWNTDRYIIKSIINDTKEC